MESEKLILQDFVYIATLSDFGHVWPKQSSTSAMLKLDVVPGEYNLEDYLGGYLLVKDGYTPNLKHVVKIFNNRDTDKGLSATYHDGEVKDEARMRFFNDYFRFHLQGEYLERLLGRCPYDYEDSFEEYDSLYEDTENDKTGNEEDSWSEDSFDRNIKLQFKRKPKDGAPIKKLKELPAYHNLPVLFYLNKYINNEDLSKISLKSLTKENCGNVAIIWRVVHDQFGDIGMAVQQNELYDMMGDQAGLAFFASDSANAFGNFNYYKLGRISDIDKAFLNEWVTYPNYEYKCIRNPCNCDFCY